MKKFIMVMQLVLVASTYSTIAAADHGYREHHGYNHHHNHHPRHRHFREEVIYYAPPTVQYYAPAPVQYYAPPVVHHYSQPQPPVQHYNNQYDQRSSQGLVGGVVGSVFGYEAGRGDPVATGLGAAAGAYVGNRW